MRFLDLDLDFFISGDAYRSEDNGDRLSSGFKPWSSDRVQHFLEDRCGLSRNTALPGRVVESHDKVLDFWRMLIKTGRLKTPFAVVHIDTHPDLWVGDALSLTSDLLHIDAKHGRDMLKSKQVHSGNFISFAIVFGWIDSLTWVTHAKYFKDLSKYHDGTGYGTAPADKEIDKTATERDLPVAKGEHRARFRILPWDKFRTDEPFDYMALSRSPKFTPPESDSLVTVIAGYMKRI